MAMKPIQIDDSLYEKLEPQIEVQEVSTSRPKSTDPNFPVFSIRPGEYVLIYVPKHLRVDAEGNASLLMDTPLLHPVSDGNYSRYRCTQGINVGGNDGICPWCEGNQEGLNLANGFIARDFARRGWSEDRRDDEAKDVRRKYFQQNPINRPNRFYTFPIVVITNQGATDIREARKPKIVDGNLETKTFWMTLSENQWEKFLDPLNSLEDVPEHPGGQFYLLNYTNVGNAKTESDKRREAGKNFTASIVPGTDKGSWPAVSKSLDESTLEWTPRKAMNVVVSNQFLPYEEEVVMVEKLLEPMRVQADMANAAEGGITSSTRTAEAISAPSAEVTGSVVAEGEIDEPEVAEEVIEAAVDTSDEEPSFNFI